MDQPAQLNGGSKHDVWLLKKSPYGLDQSERQCNTRLDELLMTEGLRRFKVDPSVYFNIAEGIIVGMYVDDIVTSTEKEKKVQTLKKDMKKEFGVKDLGETSHILSLRIQQHQDGKLTLGHKTYAKEITGLFGMKDAKGASSSPSPRTKFRVHLRRIKQGVSSCPNAAELSEACFTSGLHSLHCATLE